MPLVFKINMIFSVWEALRQRMPGPVWKECLHTPLTAITPPHAEAKLCWIMCFPPYKGFPGGSDSKESTYYAGDPALIPGSGRFPWRRIGQSTPVFLPGESQGQRSLAGQSTGSQRVRHIHCKFSSHVSFLLGNYLRMYTNKTRRKPEKVKDFNLGNGGLKSGEHWKL